MYRQNSPCQPLSQLPKCISRREKREKREKRLSFLINGVCPASACVQVAPFYTAITNSAGIRNTRKCGTESEETWINGIKQLLSSTLVLTLAWAIGGAMKALGTDTFIAAGVSESVDKRAIPVLVFILSAVISMATGTSWGTSMLLLVLYCNASLYCACTCVLCV